VWIETHETATACLLGYHKHLLEPATELFRSHAIISEAFVGERGDLCTEEEAQRVYIAMDATARFHDLVARFAGADCDCAATVALIDLEQASARSAIEAAAGWAFATGPIASHVRASQALLRSKDEATSARRDECRAVVAVLSDEAASRARITAACAAEVLTRPVAYHMHALPAVLHSFAERAVATVRTECDAMLAIVGDEASERARIMASAYVNFFSGPLASFLKRFPTLLRSQVAMATGTVREECSVVVALLSEEATARARLATASAADALRLLAQSMSHSAQVADAIELRVADSSKLFVKDRIEQFKVRENTTFVARLETVASEIAADMARDAFGLVAEHHAQVYDSAQTFICELRDDATGFARRTGRVARAAEAHALQVCEHGFEDTKILVADSFFSEEDGVMTRLEQAWNDFVRNATRQESTVTERERELHCTIDQLRAELLQATEAFSNSTSTLAQERVARQSESQSLTNKVSESETKTFDLEQQLQQRQRELDLATRQIQDLTEQTDTITAKHASEVASVRDSLSRTLDVARRDALKVASVFGSVGLASSSEKFAALADSVTALLAQTLHDGIISRDRVLRQTESTLTGMQRRMREAQTDLAMNTLAISSLSAWRVFTRERRCCRETQAARMSGYTEGVMNVAAATRASWAESHTVVEATACVFDTLKSCDNRAIQLEREAEGHRTSADSLSEQVVAMMQKPTVANAIVSTADDLSRSTASATTGQQTRTLFVASSSSQTPPPEQPVSARASKLSNPEELPILRKEVTRLTSSVELHQRALEKSEADVIRMRNERRQWRREGGGGTRTAAIKLLVKANADKLLGRLFSQWRIVATTLVAKRAIGRSRNASLLASATLSAEAVSRNERTGTPFDDTGVHAAAAPPRGGPERFQRSLPSTPPMYQPRDRDGEPNMLMSESLQTARSGFDVSSTSTARIRSASREKPIVPPDMSHYSARVDGFSRSASQAQERTEALKQRLQAVEASVHQSAVRARSASERSSSALDFDGAAQAEETGGDQSPLYASSSGASTTDEIDVRSDVNGDHGPGSPLDNTVTPTTPRRREPVAAVDRSMSGSQSASALLPRVSSQCQKHLDVSDGSCGCSISEDF
jgi:hypothetical protein